MYCGGIVTDVVVGQVNQEAKDVTDDGIIDGDSGVPAKAKPPILVTLLGIVTDVSPKHDSNALPPIEMTPVGIETDVSPVPLKAAAPIDVTVVGIETDVSAEQNKKRPSPIEVPLAAMVITQGVVVHRLQQP